MNFSPIKWTFSISPELEDVVGQLTRGLTPPLLEPIRKVDSVRVETADRRSEFANNILEFRAEWAANPWIVQDVSSR